jgi:hypothetical protein
MTRSKTIKDTTRGITAQDVEFRYGKNWVVVASVVILNVIALSVVEPHTEGSTFIVKKYHFINQDRANLH